VNPLRKKRLLIIVAILAGVGIAVSLALSALKENINLFYTPTQIASGEAPRDTRIRAGGIAASSRTCSAKGRALLPSAGSMAMAWWWPMKCWPNTTRNTCRRK
jgi:hypothetical protein